MISPQELRQKMLESDCEVTARRLTDWRSKGLLPALESQGRGKGRGKTYFWNDPEILVRAQLLHHAFQHGATAEIATLSLVHAGFYVEPKIARRTWIKHLAKSERLNEKQIEPGERPRDHYWDRGLKIAPQISDQGISEDVIGPLTAEALVTIHARRGFRPSPDELSDITVSANKFMAAAMAKSRHSHLTAPPMDEQFIGRALQLIREWLSVTATKELLKGTDIDQFDLAISSTRLIVCAFETLIATQAQGHTRSTPMLEIRMIFRAILGPRMTAFFLHLIGAGYERKLLKSLKLLEVFIATCEAHPGRTMSPEKPEISQELQAVGQDIYSNLKEIWRDSDLFRLYYIA